MKPKLYQLNFKFYIGESDLRISHVGIFNTKREAEQFGNRYAKDSKTPDYICSFVGVQHLRKIDNFSVLVDVANKPKLHEKRYATAYWLANDILDYAKNSLDINISKKKIEKILKTNEEKIEDAMSSAGWEVIEQAIDDMFPES